MTLRKTLSILLTFGLTALIVWGALRSVPPIPKLFDQQDKLEHVMAFGALTLWLHVMFGPRNWRMCILLAIFGAFMLEICQSLFAYGRSLSLLDFAASLTGIGLAAWFIYRARLYVHQKKRATRRAKYG